MQATRGVVQSSDIIIPYVDTVPHPHSTQECGVTPGSALDYLLDLLKPWFPLCTVDWYLHLTSQMKGKSRTYVKHNAGPKAKTQSIFHLFFTALFSAHNKLMPINESSILKVPLINHYFLSILSNSVRNIVIEVIHQRQK